jgi:hypothetical protein
MVDILREAHSGWRYLVILAAVVVIVKMLIGWLSAGKWSSLDRQLGMIFVSVLDIQFLLGIVLWIMLGGWSLPGSYVPAWEHPVTMILAIAAAHGFWSAARKREPDSTKFRIATLGFIVSGLLIAVGVARVTGVMG